MRPRGGIALCTAVLLIHPWEKTVWAGFLQTRLQRRHSITVAALIAAAPFTAMHTRLLLIGETSTSGLLVGVAKLLALGVGMRLMVGVFLRATGSLLAAGILHGVYNASNNAGGLIDGLLDGADQNLAAPIALVVVTAAVAAHLHHREDPASPPKINHQVSSDGTENDRVAAPPQNLSQTVTPEMGTRSRSLPKEGRR